MCARDPTDAELLSIVFSFEVLVHTIASISFSFSCQVMKLTEATMLNK